MVTKVRTMVILVEKLLTGKVHEWISWRAGNIRMWTWVVGWILGLVLCLCHSEEFGRIHPFSTLQQSLRAIRNHYFSSISLKNRFRRPAIWWQNMIWLWVVGTLEYNHVSCWCSLETYMILLTNVTQRHSIKIRLRQLLCKNFWHVVL